MAKEYSYLDNPTYDKEEQEAREDAIIEKYYGKKKKKKFSASNKVAIGGSAAEFDEEDYHTPVGENKNASWAAKKWIKKMYPNSK